MPNRVFVTGATGVVGIRAIPLLVGYNRTVLDAESSAARFSAAGGTGTVLRFAGFYGPDAYLRDMLGVIKRGWSPLPGPGGAYWSSLSHEDAATAVVASIGVGAGIYNACDDEPLTRREWAEVLAEAVRARRCASPAGLLNLRSDS